MISDVVFIGGRSGTGKTSVGFEMHAQLSASDIPHCLIEGDLLDMSHPVLWEFNLAERNLADIWANYRERGHHRMIYVNTVCVLPEQITRLTTAIGGRPNVTAILLTCTDTTARERLNRREIGSTLDRHLASSMEMSTRLQSGAAASAHHISTDDRTVASIGAEIIIHSGWKRI